MANSFSSIVPPAAVAERIEGRVLLSSTLTGFPTLASGDFNGDGLSETLVFVTAGRARLADLGMTGRAFRRGSLLLLDVNGGLFGGPLSVRARGNAAPVVAAADFNSDGRLDLVVGGRRVSGARQGLTFLAGNGDGTFAAGVPIAGAPSNVTSLVAGDFNGDGHADLAGTARGPSAGSGVSSTVTQVRLNNHGTTQRRAVDLGIANPGANRPHDAGVSAEAGAGALGSMVGVPPGNTPPAARVGVSEETGAAVLGGFGSVFFDGSPFVNEQVFTLLGNGDGTFRAADAASAG
jgi:VCBS repeat protein